MIFMRIIAMKMILLYFAQNCFSLFGKYGKFLKFTVLFTRFGVYLTR